MSYFSYLSNWFSPGTLQEEIANVKLRPALARNFKGGIPPSQMVVLSQTELDKAIQSLRKTPPRPKIHFGSMNDVVDELKQKFAKRNFNKTMNDLLDFFTNKKYKNFFETEEYLNFYNNF